MPPLGSFSLRVVLHLKDRLLFGNRLGSFIPASQCNLNRRNFCDSKEPKPPKLEPPKPEHPFNRTVRVLKGDIMSLKKRIFPVSADEIDQEIMKDAIPEHCDVLIIGGGIIGSSIAYWLKQRALKGLNIVVVEKEPTYSNASTVLSVGGLRQQFSLPENIQMSMFAVEFFRNINRHLGIENSAIVTPTGNNDDIDIHFTPYGYLFLATERGAEQLRENCKLQKELGAKNELLTNKELKEKFPWMNVEGIELGCHGLEGEGWFDPWTLLQAFKRKAYSLGVHYVNAEAVGFQYKLYPDLLAEGIEPGSYEGLDKVLIRTPEGEIKAIKFAIGVIAAGAQSGEVAKMARIGVGKGLLSIPLPVEPRKRFVYCYHSPDGPGLNTPLTIDPSGTYFRREGLLGNYIGGKSPNQDSEPSVETGLEDVDLSYFDSDVWPHLAKRVPAFEKLKVKSAWAGFYDHNYFDENGIIGSHPYYHNLYLACGFSGHGLQQAPAVGRAIMELILDGEFRTIDLSRMSFDRIITREKLEEQNIV